MSEDYNMRKLENAILNVIKFGLSLTIIFVISWSISAIYKLNYIISDFQYFNLIKENCNSCHPLFQNIINIPIILTIGLWFLFLIPIIRIILVTLTFCFSEKKIYALYSLPILIIFIIVIVGGI